MEQALRDLIEAAQKWIGIHDPVLGTCPDNNYLVAMSAAEKALRNGGWKKWPEEKPEKIGLYIVYFKDDPMDGTDYSIWYWRNSPKEWDDLYLKYWRPLPLIPETPHD